MSIYYAIVEGDPLDNGNGYVLTGSEYSLIDNDKGRHRKQTHLGQLAYCGVCQSSGSILAKAQIRDSLRGYDARLQAYEAVDGDMVLCKCERHPRVMACYARSVMYIDEGRTSPVVAQSATHSSRTYDEQVTASARGVSLQGYPFLIETSDGQTVCGRADGNGRLPRIYTDSASSYAIHWGDDALSHEGWSNAE
ncbi:hypothetical protein E2553_05020 [Paraburkholderia dipogonis]|uniref:PAAR domain-containing protein n=1 Tax=Paraburkholderia dipogonis TaxID=1211383 RepID=A0A4Y8N461_9BURK|nr:hypothetical protein [Paraburkholderia dipogonis]TFE44445.1 hypothetical protein E2553_05020 [Paraburkholderia dipogonis]